MIINDLVIQSNIRCKQIGLNPDELPIYTQCYSEEELKAKQGQYKDIIEVISVFVEKFLSTVANEPFFLAISDDRGYILEFRGNKSIIENVRELGVMEGVRYNEELGTNAIYMCLSQQMPIQLVGDDHYHKVLHQMACYTAPFYMEDKSQLLGTISIMTDIQFAHPHLLALLCTIVDSIERELLLRKHNTQLQILNQVLLETNYYGVIITDAQGTIVEINKNCAALLSDSKHNNKGCIGTSAFQVEVIGAYFERVLQHDEPCVGVEISILVEEMQRYYMLDVVPIYDSERQLTRVVGTLRDITEMKLAEELLRNNEKLVFAGQLAVSIAHEIRNPMTTVKGMLQLSSKTTNPQHYNLMMSELERMNAIVGEYLILGRPQAIQYTKQYCDVILHEVISVFELQFEMNGIELRSQTVEKTEILCDRDQVKQVFLNILKNAMEALPFGGKVNIVLDVENGFQRIRFIDNGVGMTDEVMRRIGQPFHTTRSDGNGLGMMIVDKIISSHGGRLSLSSELGAGTIVEVSLPAL